MRAAPPLQVTLARQGLWCFGLGLLGLAVAASMGAWWLSQPRPVQAWVSLSVAAGAVFAPGCLVPLIRLRPSTLRWDGQSWHLGPGEGAPSGRLGVAIDLGEWMLLRFTSEGRVTSWIPVQRQGLEPSWHALRCAVYSPRPTPAAPADG